MDGRLERLLEQTAIAARLTGAQEERDRPTDAPPTDAPPAHGTPAHGTAVLGSTTEGIPTVEAPILVVAPKEPKKP